MKRLTAEIILQDESVFRAFTNANARFMCWRQVVDATMHFIFCMHSEYSQHCNDVLLRRDLQKHIKMLFNGSNAFGDENLQSHKNLTPVYEYLKRQTANN